MASRWHFQPISDMDSVQGLGRRCFSEGNLLCAAVDSTPSSEAVVVVAKGPFYELELRSAVSQEGSTPSLDIHCNFEDMLKKRWSEEDEETAAESGQDTDSLVDTSSDESSKDDLLWNEHSEFAMGNFWAFNPSGFEMSWDGGLGAWAQPACNRRSHASSGHRQAQRPVSKAVDTGAQTTVMVQGLTASTSSKSLVDLLDAHGLAGHYDFIYVPANFSTWEAVGYGIINMVSHASALQAMELLEELPGQKLSVSWNEPCQGLDVQIERYRNSPVMHDSVADDFKPRLFHSGIRQPFPWPTRSLKAPRVRTVKH